VKKSNQMFKISVSS